MKRTSTSIRSGGASVQAGRWSWLAALVAIGFGVYLLHQFESEPDARFPSGRGVAQGFCYVLIVAGAMGLYAYAAVRGWVAFRSGLVKFFVTVVLTMLTAMVLIMRAETPDAGMVATNGFLWLRLGDAEGRVVLLVVGLIFAGFSLIGWCAVVGELRRKRKGMR